MNNTFSKPIQDSQDTCDTADLECAAIRVLLVEDNPGDVQLVRMMLQDQDRGSFELNQCETLLEAKDILDCADVDVVLLDLGLPDSNGMATVSEVASSTPSVPIVILTGSNDPQLSAIALRAGSQDYLVKGKFNDDSLAQSLINAIERHEIRQRAAYFASHDHVTGLANRSSFLEFLETAICDLQKQREPFALHVLDINRFKTINENLGVSQADKLLHQVGQRLKDELSSTSQIARLGSDEFAIFDRDIAEISAVPERCQFLVDTFQKPFDIEGQTISTGVTVGTALFPVDGQSANDLLTAANYALLSAKDSNTPFYLSNAGIRAQYIRRTTIESKLKDALKNGKFEVHYQPKVCLTNGTIAGVEALSRLHDDDFGQISPVEFIPIAETSELIEEIDVFVLTQAAADARKWAAELGRDISVAVNCSARRLQSPKLETTVVEVLQTSGLAPNLLELEITETAVLESENMESVVTVLKSLQAKGVCIAMDDFGTGYSSLSYLQRLPYSTIKIDREFVEQIETNETAREIVRAIVGLGNSLKKQVVAEGVQTPYQSEFLADIGCHFGQGYLFYKPMPAKEIAKALAAPAFSWQISNLQDISVVERPILANTNQSKIASA